jgi:hypothetical protein
MVVVVGPLPPPTQIALNIGKHQQQESHFFVIATNDNGIERLSFSQQPRRCLLWSADARAAPLALAVWIALQRACPRCSLLPFRFGIFGPTFELRPQPLSTID